MLFEELRSDRLWPYNAHLFSVIVLSFDEIRIMLLLVIEQSLLDIVVTAHFI